MKKLYRASVLVGVVVVLSTQASITKKVFDKASGAFQKLSEEIATGIDNQTAKSLLVRFKENVSASGGSFTLVAPSQAVVLDNIKRLTPSAEMIPIEVTSFTNTEDLTGVQAVEVQFKGSGKLAITKQDSVKRSVLRKKPLIVKNRATNALLVSVKKDAFWLVRPGSTLEVPYTKGAVTFTIARAGKPLHALVKDASAVIVSQENGTYTATPCTMQKDEAGKDVCVAN